jgi:hypothetical protein
MGLDVKITPLGMLSHPAQHGDRPRGAPGAILVWCPRPT